LNLPRTYERNVACEQSLGSSQSLSLTYVGAIGRDLLRVSNILNPNPNFGQVILTDNSATSNYQALQVKFERRLSQGLQALASNTWSHSIDIASTDAFANYLNAPNSVAGDRKANPSLIHGAEHDSSRTLHSPSALEKIGVVTGAGLVLGPFGFSVSAVECARKNGADSGRIQAIDLLAEDKTEGVRDQMKSALDDKDPGVRAAAATVLGNFHRSQDSKDIATLLDDPKLPVRLAAAAAYIDCLSNGAKTGTRHR
jgi:HEAT repeat protein